MVVACPGEKFQERVRETGAVGLVTPLLLEKFNEVVFSETVRLDGTVAESEMVAIFDEVVVAGSAGANRNARVMNNTAIFLYMHFSFSKRSRATRLVVWSRLLLRGLFLGGW